MKESIVFYKSFYEAIQNIPQEEQLKLYNAIFSYSFTDTEPEIEDGIAKAMFILMKPNIDSANARYKASVENGKKGGRPKKENQKKPKKNLSETQGKANANLNDNDNEDDNVNDNVNEKYINLLNKYKNKINENSHGIYTSIQAIGEMKKEADYGLLSNEEQTQIFNELMFYKSS